MILDGLMLSLLGTQLLVDIIILSLISFAFNIFNDSPSLVRFLFFAITWTLFALAVLVALPPFLPRFLPKSMPQTTYPIIFLAIEGITSAFWFAAFIRLAVWMSKVRGSFCNTGCHVEPRAGTSSWVQIWPGQIGPDGFCKNACRSTEAAIVFGILQSLLWTTTTVLTALGLFHSRRITNKADGGEGAAPSTVLCPNCASSPNAPAAQATRLPPAPAELS